MPTIAAHGASQHHGRPDIPKFVRDCKPRWLEHRGEEGKGHQAHLGSRIRSDVCVCARTLAQVRRMKGEQEVGVKGKGTYSSRTKLPKDMPPQLMPPMRLPARDSLRLRLTLSRFWLFIEIGLGPALTNESCRLRPKEEASSEGPVVMSTMFDSYRLSSASAIVRSRVGKGAEAEA